MKNTEAVKQAKREIQDEKKREKVEQAKQLLRQIEILKESLSELEKQIAEF